VAQNDVMQIKLNNLPVGIMGLKAVMEEMAITNADSPDEVVREELFKRLAKKNYIPE
jgi:hypothetical protein